MVSSPEEFQKGFKTETYLSARYSCIDDWDETTPKGLHKFYSNGVSGLKIFEIGCGPVIVHSAAPYASEIVLSDLVDSNLEAVLRIRMRTTGRSTLAMFYRHWRGKGKRKLLSVKANCGV